MRTVIVFLPIAALVFAWLVGRARITRAVVAFGIWVLICEAFIVASILVYPPNPAYFIAGIAMLVISIPVAVVVGLTGRHQTSPIKTALETYNGLDDETKQKVRDGASIVGKFAAKFATEYGERKLNEKGFTKTAETLRNTTASFI